MCVLPSPDCPSLAVYSYAVSEKSPAQCEEKSPLQSAPLPRQFPPIDTDSEVRSAVRAYKASSGAYRWHDASTKARPVEPLALSIRQAAKVMGIDRHRLTDMVERGEIPHVVYPGTVRRRILVEDLRAWMRLHRRRGVATQD